MKISAIKPFAVKGRFRYWVFVKVETDTGLIGWGDASDWDAPFSITEAVRYLEPFLIGKDPFDVEKIWWNNTQIFKRMWGGIAWKAMSGIDTALWDIKGKALGVPVWQLLGGKIRDRLRLYWTHCGSAQFAHHQYLNSPRLRSIEDLKKFCERVAQSGLTALKTNIMAMNGTPLYGVPREEIFTGKISNEEVETACMEIEVFRKELGNKFGIALDTAFDYRLDGALNLARALEPYDMMWLETETFDVNAQEKLAYLTTTPIVHGESLYDLHGYLPYLQRHAQKTIMVDLAWNGLTMGKKIADLALAFDTAVSPHNCHSPLTTFVAAQFCASIKNFDILEIDYDDVPWRDELITEKIQIENGYLLVPERPGLGTDLIEEKLLEYAVER